MVHAQDPYLRQLSHFRAVAEGGEAPLCSALDGWRARVAAQGLLEAARSGSRITCVAAPS